MLNRWKTTPTKFWDPPEGRFLDFFKVFLEVVSVFRNFGYEFFRVGGDD